MRLLKPVLLIGVTFIVACGDGEDRSPREICTDTEEEINVAASQCDPQHGSIQLSCSNFGTGSSCGTIDEYFACLAHITCDNGSVVRASGCALGACE